MFLDGDGWALQAYHSSDQDEDVMAWYFGGAESGFQRSPRIRSGFERRQSTSRRRYKENVRRIGTDGTKIALIRLGLDDLRSSGNGNANRDGPHRRHQAPF